MCQKGRPFQQCYFGSDRYNQNPSKITNMKESMVVSMTGFVNNPSQQAYKTMIQDLRMRLAPVLSEQTSVLIVNDVSTQKYKIAKKYDTPISCVSVDWLLQCRQRNRLIPAANYHIRQLFYGVEVKIVGFDEKQSQKLMEKINSNGGHAVVLAGNSELSELSQLEEKTSLILTSQVNLTKLQPYLSHIPYPVVSEEWIEDSLRGELCKYPFDYALNQNSIFHKEPIDHLPKMKKKLDLQLATQPIDQFQPKILDNTYIHMSSNVHPEISVLLKKLVMVYGGFYLDEFSPMITHILTEPVTMMEYEEMKNHGVLVHVLKVQWLIDSIYIHKRMKEEDYQIRSFRPKISSSAALEDMQNSMMMGNNSTSFHSIGVNGMPMFLNSRKSISAINSQGNQPKTQKEVKVLRKYDSMVFKSYRFYVQSTQKKQIELHDLTTKIVKNGGQVFNSRADIKEGHCYYVLKDAVDMHRYVEKLQSDTRGKVQVQPVSYRWINESLTKNIYIDLNKTDSLIYKPFNFKTPIPSFHKMIFEVLGVDDVHKLRLKELYNTLGSSRNIVNKSEVTHCLCGPHYHETARYKQLKKENTNVKYVSEKWLIQCAYVGKIVQVGKYLMERDGHGGSGHQGGQNVANQNVTVENIFPLAVV